MYVSTGDPGAPLEAVGRHGVAFWNGYNYERANRILKRGPFINMEHLRGWSSMTLLTCGDQDVGVLCE
jgi:hypothetical protein